MAIDPSISLQGRGVDIKPLDPIATLVQVAQLKNLTAQADLRNLQMQELAATQQEYRGLQAPGGPLAQLQGLRQPGRGGTPGMVPASALSTLLPGGGNLVPPAAPLQQTYAHEDIGQPGDPMPFGRTAIPSAGTAYTQAPAAMQPPGLMPPAPPSQVPGSPQQGPGAPLPPDTGTGAQSLKRAAILEEMQLKYPRVAQHLITPMIALDTHLMSMKKGELEFQMTGLGLVEQTMASVKDQPTAVQPQAYAQARQALIDRGVPGAAQQLPEAFDPQRVDLLATSARDKKTRVEQQLTLLGKENDAWKNAIEQAKLGDGTWKQDASGFQFFVPNTPGAKTGPLGGASSTAGPGAPAMNPITGQPYKGMDAQRMQVEHEQSLGAAFQAQIKPFIDVRNAYNQVQAASTPDPKNPGASDTALLAGYRKLIEANAGTMKPEDLRSTWEQFQKLWEGVSKGQALLEPQRKAIRDEATKVYGAAEQVYEQQLGTARQQAGAYTNVRPHIVAPDIRANSRPYTTADVDAAFQTLQQAGRSTTRAQVEQYFQSQGRRKGD